MNWLYLWSAEQQARCQSERWQWTDFYFIFFSLRVFRLDYNSCAAPIRKTIFKPRRRFSPRT